MFYQYFLKMKVVVQFVTLLGKITFNFDEPGVIQTCKVDTRKRVEIKHDFIHIAQFLPAAKPTGLGEHFTPVRSVVSAKTLKY